MSKTMLERVNEILGEDAYGSRPGKMSDEARELELYIDNDADLYRQRKIPIYKNLSKKMKKGKFDKKLAAKGFMYLVDDGAKKYTKEFGSPGQKWGDMFPKKDRMVLAAAFADEFEEAFENKEYDFM